jgi:DNA (cytosine-5)-methyltransferase 1
VATRLASRLVWTRDERRQVTRILRWYPVTPAPPAVSQIAPPSGHEPAVRSDTQSSLVLSLFSGVGLLDAAFEAEGICTVRGPDLLWGGDVRRFHPPAGCWWGVIGGPPCQDFSTLRRAKPTGDGEEMLGEFRRVVLEAKPEWWLLENVATVPDVRIEGYSWQRIDVDQAWYAPVSRLRHIQFGSRDGRTLQIPRGTRHADCEPCALASDDRPFEVLRRLQGLPDGYDLPGFTRQAAKTAIGNGVPIVLGRVLARAVLAAYGHEVSRSDVTEAVDVESLLLCHCGCGRRVTGRKRYDSAACRKRAERRRRCGTACTQAVSVAVGEDTA